MADPKAPAGGFQQGGWYEGRQYWNGTFSEKGQINSQSDQVGAGQMVSREVVNQSDPLKNQAVGTDWNYLHGGSQQPTAQNQVDPYLNNYQTGAFASDGAVPSKTRTPDEIKAMLTPDLPKPEQFSSVAEFEKLREERGVAGLEEKQVALKAQLEEEAAILRSQRYDEQGKPVALNVIAGRVTEEERAYNERIDAVNRQLNTINDQLNTSYQVINMYMGFMEGDYQRATDAYNSEFDRNLQVYNVVRGEERDARSDFESDRANASANLTTYMNAITNGNLSYGNLDSSQKLMIQKLEIQSGMPQGFVSQLQMAPGDRMVTFNDKTGEALMTNADGSFSVVKTGMRPSPTSQSQSDITLEQTRFASNAMMESRGQDGYVDPEGYRNAKARWTAATGKTVKEFDDIFSQYANPVSLESYGIADTNKEVNW